MLCAHVSPSGGKEELYEAFKHLRDSGGDNVLHWYVVGPFAAHFNVGQGHWKSPADIKKTFKKKLGNKAARYLVLDSSAEKSNLAGHPWGLDIRAQKTTWLGVIWFDYRPWPGKPGSEWQRFNPDKFTRL